jgi:hypothetical protein
MKPQQNFNPVKLHNRRVGWVNVDPRNLNPSSRKITLRSYVQVDLSLAQYHQRMWRISLQNQQLPWERV